MKEENLTLENPFYAYLFGFALTDGHLYEQTRNRGRLRIELSKRDENLLREFQKRLPFKSTITKRVRNTNFSKEYISVNWSVYDKRFRNWLVESGFQSGSKSKIISMQIGKYSTVDYFRGLLDGDGSLSLTAQGFPFLSLITSSPIVAKEYLKFLESVTGKKKTSKPNKRDNVQNIAVYKEDAQKVVKQLYYINCLALERKSLKAKDVLSWRRPKTMKRIENRKRWTIDEDKFILSN